MLHLFRGQTHATPTTKNTKYTQNEALRIAAGYHKMFSIDHLHVEAEMLKVKEHSDLLSAQYLTRCMEPENFVVVDPHLQTSMKVSFHTLK